MKDKLLKTLIHINSQSQSPGKVIIKCDNCNSRYKYIEGSPGKDICIKCGKELKGDKYE